MGDKWPYSCCFVACCLQDLFNITRRILVELPSSFFSIRLVSVHVVHPYSSIDKTAAWKKLCFISSVWSDFHMTDRLSIAVHGFARRMLMSVSIDETLLRILAYLKYSVICVVFILSLTSNFTEIPSANLVWKNLKGAK